MSVLKYARGSTDLLSEGELVGDVAALESRPFFTGDGFSEWEWPESVCIFKKWQISLCSPMYLLQKVIFTFCKSAMHVNLVKYPEVFSSL